MGPTITGTGTSGVRRRSVGTVSEGATSTVQPTGRREAVKIKFISFAPKSRLPGRWHFELMTFWHNNYSAGLLILKRGIEVEWATPQSDTQEKQP